MSRNDFMVSLRQKAFTLVEVMMAVILIAILAGVSFSQYNKIVERTHAKDGEYILYSRLASLKRFLVEHDEAATILDSDLDISLPNTEFFGGGGFSVSSDKRCLSVTIGRKGGSSATISIPPPPCMTGVLSGLGNMKYVLRLYADLSGGVTQFQCYDHGSGICSQLGY